MRESHAIPAARTCSGSGGETAVQAAGPASCSPPATARDVGSAHGKVRDKVDANWGFSVYHGMVWVGKEGTSKSHPVQHPCNEQGQLQIHQVEILPVSKDGASTPLGNLCQCLITLAVTFASLYLI